MLSKDRREELQDIVDLDDPLQPEKKRSVSKKFKRRMWAFAAAVAIFTIAIVLLADAFVNKEPGWRRIDLRPGSISQAYNAEFVFYYNVGQTQSPVGSEFRKLQNLYTQALSDAKSLYSLKKLNASPNTELKVTKELYSALKKLSDIGDRRVFLAPVYEQYMKVFEASSDSTAAASDPYRSEAAMEYVNKLMEFIGSSRHIDISFGSNNHLTLSVSEEYLSFAKKNNIAEYADFFWMENALMVDYVSDVMIENGFTQGKLFSYDGFSRSLDMKEGYAQIIIRRSPDRNFDISRYHLYEDGSVRHPYIDAENGLCCDIPKDFGVHQDGYTCECFDTLLSLLPSLKYSGSGIDGLQPSGENPESGS